MSYLETVNVDPHLGLLALEMNKHAGDKQTEKIQYLTKTRKFDQLLAEVKKVPSLVFPTLPASKSVFIVEIEKAKSDNAKLKIELDEEHIFEVISKLDNELEMMEESENNELD